MARLEIEQVLVLSDNYVYLLHDPDSGATAVVDPAEPGPVLERLAEKGWRLTHVLNTHHHTDHTGGNLALKAATGCRVLGAAVDQVRGWIPGQDQGLSDGDTIALGGIEATILALPGHTSGHLAYWFKADQAVFCGDILFALGCGRLFEEPAETMWSSLDRLRGLPSDTRIFCAHEYTQNNARFARAIEPGNPALLTRIAEVDRLRAAGQPTVPSLLGDELATNPFLRSDQPAVALAVGLEGAPPAKVFAELRRRKDHF